MMMMDSTNYHVSYPDVNRHWSPKCERIAGGDALVTALMRGWTFSSTTIYFEEFWLAGTRPVTVYHFEMQRGQERMLMPVMSNPYVRRVLRMHRLQVKPMEEKLASREQDADAA